MSTKSQTLLACCLLVSSAAAFAQSKPEPNPNSSDHLRLVVILSRHGVRSPTWAQDRLDIYSALPWPKWSVPPGDLTPRGHQLIATFARYDRVALSAKGLFAATGCVDAAHTYLWADTDQRTTETAHALAEGLFPGCPLQVHSLAAGENDPIFHPTAHGVSPEKADAAYAEFSARAKQPGDPSQPARMQELQRVLLGCSIHSDCTPAHQPQTILDPSHTDPSHGDPSHGDPSQTGASRGKGDKIVDLKGPLPTASTLSEDLLLEYADGMPMDQVGWGNLDEAELSRLLALHSAYFDLVHRTPALARLESANMLSHILRTLQQGVEDHTVQGALGPPGSKLVMLAGHDTNLAGVASLLGVHWNIDSRADDTPPGTELAFELWQDSAGRYSVHVSVAMQTLNQLRNLTTLTPQVPPAHQDLKLPACPAAACAWNTFQTSIESAIEPETTK